MSGAPYTNIGQAMVEAEVSMRHEIKRDWYLQLANLVCMQPSHEGR